MSAFKELGEGVKPRERMEMLGGAHGMRPDELLAILLKTGARGCDVGELSRRLLTAFSSIGELVRCDWKTLMMHVSAYNKTHAERRILGLGKVKCMELAAAFELVRIAYEEVADGELPCTVNEGVDAAAWFKKGLRLGDEREHFWVLPLDASHKPLSRPICISTGTLNGVPAGAREVFEQAVHWQAAAVVVAHNHPSGNPTPSKKDIQVTNELIAAGKVLRIPLLDHVILGRGCFVSLRDDEWIEQW